MQVVPRLGLVPVTSCSAGRFSKDAHEKNSDSDDGLRLQGHLHDFLSVRGCVTVRGSEQSVKTTSTLPQHPQTRSPYPPHKK